MRERIRRLFPKRISLKGIYRIVSVRSIPQHLNGTVVIENEEFEILVLEVDGSEKFTPIVSVS